jgi:2-iminobutanoate/2-iminopropanoate deaminase
MSDKEIIFAAGAPAPIGPYSQAVTAGDFIFCSGQIPLDPVTNGLVAGDIMVQAERVLDNLKAVLEEAGSNLDRAVKITVYLKDMNDFAALNQVFEGRFKHHPPARAVVQVAALPKNASIEVDLIALKGK